jgi:hypothetical protein
MKTKRRAKRCGKAGPRTPLEIALRFPLSYSSGDDDHLSLDDRDSFPQNPLASVASLRRLIISIPEC